MEHRRIDIIDIFDLRRMPFAYNQLGIGAANLRATPYAPYAFSAFCISAVRAMRLLSAIRPHTVRAMNSRGLHPVFIRRLVRHSRSAVKNSREQVRARVYIVVARHSVGICIPREYAGSERDETREML